MEIAEFDKISRFELFEIVKESVLQGKQIIDDNNLSKTNCKICIEVFDNKSYNSFISENNIALGNKYSHSKGDVDDVDIISLFAEIFDYSSTDEYIMRKIDEHINMF